VKRPLGYLSFLLAVLAALAAGLVDPFSPLPPADPLNALAVRVLSALATGLFVYGSYVLVSRTLVERVPDRRRRYNVRNVVRLAFVLAGVVAVFGAVTEQWVGVLFSLGVVGFAVTFALQQPLFSLIGWLYVLLKRPYQVGDRIAIDGTKGDVVAVDFLVTTLWETGGELVSSNQPSGRTVTFPNSNVLSTQVANFSQEEFPYVWNELSVQVAYETDLAFARELLVDVAEEYLGDEMAAAIERYRDQLAETPVELDVSDGPSVNVVQRESWVELRLRYLTHPRRGTRVRNALYERALAEMNEHPDRVRFPVSRNR
jgi:small-conductance mechanosensitive channel